MKPKCESEVFFPERELSFVKFLDMIPLIDLMRESFDKKIAKRRIDEKMALYLAYVDAMRTCDDEDSLVVGLGAKNFYRELHRKITDARKYFRDLISGPLSPRFSALDSFGPVQVALDPMRLFKMATAPLGSKPTVQDHRTREEAQRSFAFALQLLAWDTVESEGDVAENLALIEEIAFKKLFTGFVTFYVVIETNPDNASRSLGQPLFFETKDEAHRAALDLRQQIREEAETYEADLKEKGERVPENKVRSHEMRLAGQTVHEEKDHWECREVDINGEVWEVRHLLRDKSLPRALEKKERYCIEGTPDKVVADRGGWKYILVSIRDEKGGRRPATKDDARIFSEYTRKLLWTGPLQELPDNGPKNSTSHREYWDVKIIGRFYRKLGSGRVVASRVEQIVTTGREYLSTQTSTGGDRHYIYQAIQIFKLCTLWWPRLSWEASDRHALMQHWRKQS